MSDGCELLNIKYITVQFSRSVVSDSLRPHEYIYLTLKKEKKKGVALLLNYFELTAFLPNIFC